MTHKCRGSILAFLISKSVEPNEEQKVVTSDLEKGITMKGNFLWVFWYKQQGNKIKESKYC